VRILVTGATGFIGTALIEELSTVQNYEIYALSRVLRKDTPFVKYIVGDLNDRKFICNLQDFKFKRVYHLGWEGLPDRSENFSNLNLENSKNLLNIFAKSKEIEFDIIGSCLEFGNSTGLAENFEIPKGGNPFADAKLELNKYVKSLKVKFRWYRPFYVYGEGQGSNSLIPSIIYKLKNNDEGSVRINSLNSSHDFISVSDVAKAISVSSAMPNFFGEINVGTGELTNVGDIIRLIYSHYGYEFEKEYSKEFGLFTNSKRLRANTNWAPRYVGLAGMQEYLTTYQL